MNLTKKNNSGNGNGHSLLPTRFYNRTIITPYFPQWTGIVSQERIGLVLYKWRRLSVQMAPYYEHFESLVNSGKSRARIVVGKRDSLTFEVPVSVRVVPELKGFGVFSETYIPKGTVVYSWRNCSGDDIFQLSEFELKEILRGLESDDERSRFLSYCYCIQDWPIPNKALLELTIGRFVNHNDVANISNYNVLANDNTNHDEGDEIISNPSERTRLSDPTVAAHWDCMALSDIQKGDEITQNYNELDTFQWPWFVKLYEAYGTDRLEKGEWVKGSKHLELLKQKHANNGHQTNNGHHAKL